MSEQLARTLQGLLAMQEAQSMAYRKPHTLRHTYASLLIENGESLAYIRDQLGTIRSS